MDYSKGYIFSFIFLWVACYLIYPFWMIPGSVLARTILFVLYIVYFSLNGYLLYRWTRGRVDCPFFSRDTIPQDGVLLLLKKNKPFLFFILIYILLHLYPNWTYPIRTCGDEATHASSGIQILEVVSPMVEERLGISLKVLIKVIFFIGIFLIWGYRKFCKGQLPLLLRLVSSAKKVISLSVVSLLMLSGYFFFLRNVPFHQWLFKPPPLSRYLSLAITCFFGANEFAVRLPALLFSCLSAIFVFRLIALYRNEKIALFSSTLFLFFPNFFYYGGNAELASGTIFFFIVALFYLLRYLKKGDFSDLIISGFFVSVGFLWKESLLNLQFIFWIVILLNIIKDRLSWNKISDRLKICWFSFVPILPALIIEFTIVKYNLYIMITQATKMSFWRSLPIYFLNIPGQITSICFILFIAGFVYSLLKKKDNLFFVMLVSFIIWYVALTFSFTAWGIVHFRWQLPLYPLIAFFIGQFIVQVMTKIISERYLFIAHCSLIFFLILCSTMMPFPGLSKEYLIYQPSYPNYVREGGFLPYKEAVIYIKKNILANSRILAPDFPDPREFYAYRYKLNVDWVLVSSKKNWIALSKQNPDNLFNFCKEEKIDYIFFPDPRWIRYVNPHLVEELLWGKDERFSLIKSFELYGNKVYIWGVNRSG